jgi:hypothetical protein
MARWGACSITLAVGGMVAFAGADAAAQTLELDPGLGWSVLSGVGLGRSVYFTADEAFSITGAGFRADMAAGLYDVIIYRGLGETAPAGPIIHQVQAQLGGIGLGWQDAAIAFHFDAGADYILHFRHSVPGTSVATQYERGSTFWGNSPAEFLDLGIVTIHDGREGYNSENANNAAFPRMRLLGVVPGGGCYPNCDASTVPPILNVGDFTCFLQRFAAGDSYANCDASTVPPVLNVGDFTCFLQRFASGCR